MTGHSGTPLARKLGVKAGARLALIDAPQHAEGLLDPLPDGVQVLRRPRGPVDVGGSSRPNAHGWSGASARSPT